MSTQLNATGGLIWKFLERSLYQIINFLVTLVLARLLSPDEYGLVAIAISVIAILQVFVDSGMGTAIVQKKDLTEDDLSTVFVSNVILSILIYSMVFWIAPLLTKFYERDLTDIIRVLGIVIIVFSVKNVFQAYIVRNLQMKKAFYSSTIAILVGGFIGVLLAFKGYGVWAIVIQNIVNEIICTMLFAVQANWRPKWKFSKSSFNVCFRFGWKLLFSSLIDSIYNNIRQLIIGKYYSANDLAYYSKGDQLPNVLVTNINASINTVLLPIMSKRQDSPEEIKKIARRMIRNSSYILWPMMIGLCIVADKVIVILLTEKWIETVQYVRIFCIVYVLQPLQTTNLTVLKSLGRTDICLKLEIIKKSIALILIIVSIPLGVKAMVLSSLIYAVIATMINSFPNRRLINYTYSEQIKDIFPFVLMSLVMGIFVFAVGHFSITNIGLLILQVFVGIISYISMSVIFKVECFVELLTIIRQMLGKK